MRPLLASLAVCLLIAHPVQSQTVGMLGDWEKIEFEGLEQVDADEIRKALSWNLEFQAAARPSSSLVDLLKITEERISEGFRQCGYLNAKVEVKHDPNRERLVVWVEEGTRYTAGEFRFTGLSEIKSEEALTAIDSPRKRNWTYRKGDRLIGKTETVDSQNEWQQQTKSDWKYWDKIGGPPFNPISRGQLQEKIWLLCADRGFPYVEPKLAPHVDKTNQSVDLNLDFSSDQNRAKISRIEVQGLTRHAQLEVLDYLDLRVEMPFSADLIDRVYEALRQSCRFWSYEIEVPVLNHTDRYGQKTAEVHVVIRVVEYTEAPRLSEPLSDTERAMYQFSRWLESFGAGGRDDGDLVLKLKEESEATNYMVDLVVAPMGGWIGHVKGNLVELELDHCILNHVGSFAIYNWGHQRKISAPNSLPSAIAKLKTEAMENGEFKTSFKLSLSVSSKEGRPDFQLHAEPAALVREAHRQNNRIEIKDGVASLQSDTWELRFDAETGKLIELKGVMTDGPTRTLQCILQPGAFANEVEKVASRGLKFYEERDPEKPWTSFLRFALNECLLQPAIQNRNGTEILLSLDLKSNIFRV